MTTPPPAVARGFNDLMARMDNLMLVVTTASGRVRAGCLVGFHAQCSIDPPEYAIWLSKANHTYRVGALADTFAVHFLGAEHEGLAELFGTVSGDDTDKFERCAWSRGPDGVPLLDDVPDRFVGRRTGLFDPGTDHVCVVLSPLEVHADGSPDRLWLGEVRDLEPGHDAEERQRPD